ncbi:hypothetical protein TraAM80_03196 [Trypanosoma rangeli]|uniref:Uncharacterized protein n=1 Tax=Trypanosoma rangeli TaxID=5698 RepID=A0A3R7NK37_TRYRA|nr:uncharacterized protein TraAM80_03196 [Trypanosoma rangeli]RNF07674.1 hypothetical protein TraAM80_03196 [Trypanosoma rangeli]|eukprot:RNF07674.1 hypothetical protein TraAM80_03196 [Trypanosoma rangeli]
MTTDNASAGFELNAARCASESSAAQKGEHWGVAGTLRPPTLQNGLSQSVRAPVPSSQTPYAAGTSTPVGLRVSRRKQFMWPRHHRAKLRGRPVSSNTSPYHPRHWRIPRAEEVTPASSRPTTIIYAVAAVM